MKQNIFSDLRQASLFSPLSLRIMSAFFVFLFLFIWYVNDYEAEPWAINPGKQESTRFTTLRRIASSANQGYYFQLDPLVPMENEWEDPGQAFLMVWYGILKKTLGLGPINPFVDPYLIHFILFLIMFCLIYFTKLFTLPRWYWLVMPFFIAWAVVPKYPCGWENIHKINGLLYTSISTRGLKTPVAIWLFTMSLTFLEWWKSNNLFKIDKMRVLRLFIMGLIFGIYMSIRKDVVVNGGAAILGTLLILSVGSYSKFMDKPQIKLNYSKKIIAIVAMMLIMASGIFAFRGLIQGTWMVRDANYDMKDKYRTYGRPLWHSLIAGLGVIKNSHGITWGDRDLSEIIKSLPENKGVIYGTKEYDTAARKYFFRLLRQDPDFILHSLRHKAKLVWQDHRHGVKRSLFFIFVMLFLGAYYRRLGLIFLCQITTGHMILVIVNQWLHYGLDLITYYRFAQLIGCGICVFELTRRTIGFLSSHNLIPECVRRLTRKLNQPLQSKHGR